MTEAIRARDDHGRPFVLRHLILLMLVLAAGEVAYGIYGPFFTDTTHEMHEFSSRNRLR